MASCSRATLRVPSPKASPRSSPANSPHPSEFDEGEESNPQVILQHEGMLLQVTNSWWKAKLSHNLNLFKVAIRCKNCEYDYLRHPERLVIRSKSPRATANLFATGRMTIMGVTSEESAKAAAEIFIESIRRSQRFPGPGVLDLVEFEMSNCVGKVDLTRKVDLDRLKEAYPAQCRLERENFSALTYRCSDPGGSINVFHTGILTFTKTKSQADIIDSFLHIHNIIQPFLYE